MLIIKFLFPFLFVFGTADHDFKMSVTELVFSEEKKTFEVKVYLFVDDLTATLAGDPNAAIPAGKTEIAGNQVVFLHEGRQVRPAG